MRGATIDGGYAPQVECVGRGNGVGLPCGPTVRRVDNDAVLAARPDRTIMRDAGAAHLQGEQEYNQPAAASTRPPNRRSRRRNSFTACENSPVSNSGHMRDVK